MSVHWGPGDVVRGENPADAPDWTPSPGVTYEAYPYYVRFPRPEPPAIDLTGSTLYTVESGYDTIDIWWGISDSLRENYSWVTVVRSGFGYPAHPNDGSKIFIARRGEREPGVVSDTNLPSGRWYYYTLFAKVVRDWVKVATARALVPIDFRHRDILWNRLTPYYQMVDDDRNAGLQASPLRRIFQTIGYELDRTRTATQGVEEMWSADRAPIELISALGDQNFGLTQDDVLGDVRYRALVARAKPLFAERGTISGIRGFVETITQYQVDVTLGRNALLVSDDADFGTGVGHWCQPSAALAQVFGGYHVPALDTVRTFDVTLSVAPNGEIPVPVEVRTNPDTIIGLASMKLTPKWLPDGTWSESSRLCVVCGAGRKKDFTGDWYEQDPSLYGVPVDGGKLYYFSFYTSREGTRPQYDSAGVEIGRIAVEDDLSNVRFGIAWYDRETLSQINDKAMSDAFGPGVDDAGELQTSNPKGFSGFRRVTPVEIDSVVAPDAGVAPKVWAQYVTSFEAPDGSEFAVPYIEFMSPEISSRYIAGAMLAEEGGSGIEAGYDPDIFFVLGTNDRLLHQPPPNEARSKKLGPPRII